MSLFLVIALDTAPIGMQQDKRTGGKLSSALTGYMSQSQGAWGQELFLVEFK